jgi:GntR family histidine utilization transcriptional repressor
MQPRYVLIKSAIIDKIESGQMKPGDKVGSENQLAETFQVSRMTARRALTELVDEGVLARSQGVGTFVSDHRPMSSLLEIRSIDDEIMRRGHVYSNEVLGQNCIKANNQQAAWFDVMVGTDLFHTRVVHLENGLPVQLEDRLVNPKWAPQYLEQDFSHTTANHYLNSVAPLTQADHAIEAILPTNSVAQILAIDSNQPCLQVSRRTFSAKGIVSYALLFHPGNRYRIGGHLDFSRSIRSENETSR